MGTETRIVEREEMAVGRKHISMATNAHATIRGIIGLLPLSSLLSM
jgi:hypothetical protein